VLRCVAVCCSVLQCVAVRGSVSLIFRIQKMILCLLSGFYLCLYLCLCPSLCRVASISLMGCYFLPLCRVVPDWPLFWKEWYSAQMGAAAALIRCISLTLSLNFSVRWVLAYVCLSTCALSSSLFAGFCRCFFQTAHFVLSVPAHFLALHFNFSYLRTVVFSPTCALSGSVFAGFCRKFLVRISLCLLLARIYSSLAFLQAFKTMYVQFFSVCFAAQSPKAVPN